MKAPEHIREVVQRTPYGTFRPATDFIVKLAKREAERICAESGRTAGYPESLGALTALLTEMEQRNETPSEFVARVNGREV